MFMGNIPKQLRVFQRARDHQDTLEPCQLSVAMSRIMRDTATANGFGSQCKEH